MTGTKERSGSHLSASKPDDGGGFRTSGTLGRVVERVEANAEAFRFRSTDDIAQRFLKTLLPNCVYLAPTG